MIGRNWARRDTKECPAEIRAAPTPPHCPNSLPSGGKNGEVYEYPKRHSWIGVYEKASNELVASSDELRTVAVRTRAIQRLVEEEYPVHAEDLERLSPHAKQHLKQFGKCPSDFSP